MVSGRRLLQRIFSVSHGNGKGIGCLEITRDHPGVPTAF